jgi:hypothetical protein
MSRKNYGRIVLHPRPFYQQAFIACLTGTAIGAAIIAVLCLVPV